MFRESWFADAWEYDCWALVRDLGGWMICA
jgi:hypothetical protein